MYFEAKAKIPGAIITLKQESFRLSADKKLITSLEDDRANEIALRIQKKNGHKYGDVAPDALFAIEARLEKGGITEEEYTQWCEEQWPAKQSEAN